MLGMFRFVCLLAAPALLWPVLAMANIYSWTDSEGRVHFSDKRRSGGQPVALQPPRPDWHRASISINDAGANLRDEEREQIRAAINEVYRFYAEKLELDLYQSVSVKVLVFADVARYQAYLQRFSGLPGKYRQGKTKGVYIANTGEILVYCGARPGAMLATIRHEASHALSSEVAPGLPSWLDEGLAENMEVLSVQQGRLYLEQHNSNYRALIHFKMRRSLLALEELLGLRHRDWSVADDKRGHTLQVQSGELVRLLLAREVGSNMIRRLLHRYRRGSDFLAAQELSQLQLEWSTWIARSGSRQIRL